MTQDEYRAQLKGILIKTLRKYMDICDLSTIVYERGENGYNFTEERTEFEPWGYYGEK